MVEQIVSDRPRIAPSSQTGVARGKLGSWLLFLLVTLTLLTVFVPFNPGMPDKRITPEWLSAIRNARGNPEELQNWGLARVDESWVFAMNAAVAKHLRFGKDVVFTFGPYASIFTRSYHPATDGLMILGSLLLAIGYEIALLYLARGCKIYNILALLLFCVTFPPHDALFLSFPFLLIACAVKMNHSHVQGSKESWLELFALTIALAGLGLLPLVKGSLLAPVGLAGLLLAVFLLYRLPVRQALPLVLVPIASAISFWLIAGQSLSDIPSYVRGTMWLTSGYTEAMSTPWMAWPRLVGYGFTCAYLLIAAVILLSVARSGKLARQEKMFLGLVCATFLLVAFKHGFVRTDHLELAFQSVALFIFILIFISSDRYLVGAGTLAVLLLLLISFREDPELIQGVRQTFGTGTGTGHSRSGEVLSFVSKRALGVLSRVTYVTTFNSYADMCRGLALRLHPGALNTRFERALENVRSEYDVPVLAGTFDIYSYEQSLLVASRDKWNPRPVFQSYSAYTPELAMLNEQHLRSNNAPDWILLDLFAIDGRFPPLDDGPSWPALLDNYSIANYDGQFALLHKNSVVLPASNLRLVYQESEPVGQSINLPHSPDPLFAQIVLKPTILGKLLSVVLNPPQLTLVVHMEDGKSHTFRTVSEMMQSDFLISPLATNTGDFVALAKDDRKFEDGASVESIAISPVFGGSLFWQKNYLLRLTSRQH